MRDDKITLGTFYDGNNASFPASCSLGGKHRVEFTTSSKDKDDERFSG